jgi:hypothetical protein
MFSLRTPPPPPPVETPAAPKADIHPLDGLTGGAFSAPTAGERAAKVRAWMATDPSVDDMNEVFKELSHRDKGAAKPIREKLDELKRAKAQDHIVQEWADKGIALRDATKLNVADALAWQRDAAKAGAPLGRSPLAEIKVALTDRVKAVEGLEHTAQVQREAAALLLGRTEVLSTKPLREAQDAAALIEQDVAAWNERSKALQADAAWASVEQKYLNMVDNARQQLEVISGAFKAVLAQAVAAAADDHASLPSVPVWAEEIKAARGLVSAQAAESKAAAAPKKAKVDPAERAAAIEAVKAATAALAKEVAEGHSKQAPKLAAELRGLLKSHHRLLDAAVEGEAHAALAQAGELEGWQRWRADQLREELVTKAEALNLVAEGAKPLSGRKMQEVLRALREQWKLTDQGGAPNHGLWKKFDDACNEAYKIVHAWLDTVKAEEGKVKGEREALIAELQAFAAARANSTDYKTIARELGGFGNRWREAGHVGEKLYDQLNAKWREAMKAAEAPLDAAHKDSLARRHALIAQAKQLAEGPLNINAIKALQGQWQAESQRVSLERKLEQKLWEQFRSPIDAAFEKKTAERANAEAAVSAHDKVVLEASKAVEAAVNAGDAGAIRAAMAALEAAMRQPSAAPAAAAASAPVAAAVQEQKPQSPSAESAPVATNTEATASAAVPAESAAAADGDAAAPDLGAIDASAGDAPTAEAAPAPAPVEPPKPAKPVVARRGDDRPGGKLGSGPAKVEGKSFGKPGFGKPAFGKSSGPGGRDGGAPGGKDGAPRFGDRPGGSGGFGERRDGKFGGRDGDRFGGRSFDDAPRGPRLGDAAFRAQRDAIERAQMQLKKLAAQAHGEVVVNLLDAWKNRAADAIPTAQQLGKGVNAAARANWSKSVGQGAGSAIDAAAEPLLRLEMAAEVPTPAAALDARRALQLKLLTQRGAQTPKDTWADDAAKLFAMTHDEANAKRVMAALKVLMR